MRVVARNTTYLLYTALALVTLFGSRPIFAANEPPCDFAAFVRLRSVSDEFKTLHLRSAFHAPADNEAFLNRVIHDWNEGTSVYYHVDNAVLKMLNDKVFKDKELSAATLNLYKRLFFDELSKSPFLLARIPNAAEGGVYSDFKTIRISTVPKKPEEIEKIYTALDRLHQRVGERFAEQMQKHPEIESLYTDRLGILGDPANWNQAGYGRTAAEASVQARRNRRTAPGEEREAGKPTLPKRFGPKSVLEIAGQIREIETLRTAIEDSIQHDPRIFSEGVFTPEAIDILRRAQGDLRVAHLGDYREYVKRRFRIRFGANLSDKDADRLQRYYHLANELAPSTYIKEQEPIALAEITEATHGVVSFDISGQNGLNLRSTLLALHRAHLVHGVDKTDDGKLVNLALELTFEGQLRASDAFDESKSAIGMALRQTHLRGKGTNVEERLDGSLTASGDDATFLPSRTIGLVEQLRLMRKLRDDWTPPSRFRVTFQPQTAAHSPLTIEGGRRFELISQAEQVEKQLRDDLELAGMPFEDLKSTVFAISMHPSIEGPVLFDVLFATSKESAVDPEKLKARVKQALKAGLPNQFVLDKIYNADGIHRGND